MGSDGSTGSGEVRHCVVARSGAGVSVKEEGRHEVDDSILRTAVLKQKLSVFVQLGLYWGNAQLHMKVKVSSYSGELPDLLKNESFF
jgi:hypothetical protein